jgi:trigger factor
MKSSVTDKTKLTATLEILLSPEDYKPKFQEVITKMKSEVAMKGFRKGKTPKSLLMKMYGSRAFAEAVNETVQDNITKALEENDLQIILSPLISEEQSDTDLDHKNMRDYKFVFDVALKPDFTLKGVDKKDTVPFYKIKVDKDQIDKELDIRRKRAGTEIEGDKDILEDDRVTIRAYELNTKGNKKAKGWETGFQVLINRLEDEYQKELLKKDVGHEFEFDIYALEKNSNETYVKKYLLNLDEEEEKKIGNKFIGTVEKIHRIKPAELDQEFFDREFGKDEVKDEKGAKEKIAESFEGFYEGQATALAHSLLMEKLNEVNELEVSEEYMKKWILKMYGEEYTEEKVDQMIPNEMKGMKWDMIKDAVKEKYPFEIQPEDVKNKIRAKVMGYFGGQVPNFNIEELVNNLMSDNQQFREAYAEASTEKLLSTVLENITKEEKKVTLDEFKVIVEEFNKKQQDAIAAENPATATEEA